MNDITALEDSYSTFVANSRDIGGKIASSVSMLQLADTNEKVAKAVLEIEALTDKASPVGWLQSLPGIGKYITRARDSMDEEQLKSGKVTDVVDRLFKSLSDKKNNIMSVMEVLYNLKEELVTEVTNMVEHEKTAKMIAEHPDSGFEQTKAKNLLVQVSQSIIKSKDRIGVIDTTCKAAQASTMAISSLLPALQGELVTEMAIQGGLQELKEFKSLFDSTMLVVNELTRENNASMVKVLEDVIDLAVTRPSDLALLESNATSRVATQERLQEKLRKSEKDQDVAIGKLLHIRNTQQVLGFNTSERGLSPPPSSRGPG